MKVEEVNKEGPTKKTAHNNENTRREDQTTNKKITTNPTYDKPDNCKALGKDT